MITLALLLGGCVTGVAVKPGIVNEEPVVPQGPTVNRFDDGRQGFVLNEAVMLSEDLQQKFNDGVNLFLASDYEASIELFDDVIEQVPDVSAPHVDIAMAYRNIDRPELAEDHLNAALHLIPGHPVASQEYGLLLSSAGRFSEARDIYQQSLEVFPEYLPLRKNLGILCDLYLHDLECALEQYRAYAELQPDDEYVQLWISELQIRLGL
ncbi:MAG: hypothetical protein RQ754_10160 [Desulfuromonadales bacterium]|nr:hypothetical protein [Desulfuromonadales bacterium]